MPLTTTPAPSTFSYLPLVLGFQITNELNLLVVHTVHRVHTFNKRVRLKIPRITYPSRHLSFCS
jgi:hypothetical protein